MRRILMTSIVIVAVLALTPGTGRAGGSSSCTELASFTDKRGTLVQMELNCFVPTVIRAEPGETVTFRNLDPVGHSVGGAAGGFGDLHKEISAGNAVAYRFEEEGTYPYVCLFHPGMSGAVVIGDGEGPAASAPAGASPDRPQASGGTRRDAAKVTGGVAVAPWAIVLVLVAAGSVGGWLVRRTRSTQSVAR